MEFINPLGTTAQAYIISIDFTLCPYNYYLAAKFFEFTYPWGVNYLWADKFLY